MTHTLRIFFVVLAAALTFAGCKTNEANYRAAYEKAKEKGQSTAVDKSVYEQIDREDGPVAVTVDNVQLPVKTLILSVADTQAFPNAKVLKYNVATAKFRQVFNANSMAKRLIANGFGYAFIAKDREGDFYVVACSTGDASEAQRQLDAVKASSVGTVAPFPYVVVNGR